MYLVSACLLGLRTRFDGKKLIDSGPLIIPLNKIIPFCPEQLGGLSTPRFPAEIVNGCGEDVLEGRAHVINSKGENLTETFIRGARESLYLACLYKAEGIYLKDGSPSCGSCFIYDGTFSGRRQPGRGVTAALFRLEGIPVYNEADLFKQ
ncbi:MAG: DUF523 domain-containing protein [Bacillota bacterium]|nr:DUF523 domain-containing protein [Bacillota bacterium]